eukprot:4900734-Amphidinium_carterae.1
MWALEINFVTLVCDLKLCGCLVIRSVFGQWMLVEVAREKQTMWGRQLPGKVFILVWTYGIGDCFVALASTILLIACSIVTAKCHHEILHPAHPKAFMDHLYCSNG